MSLINYDGRFVIDTSSTVCALLANQQWRNATQLAHSRRFISTMIECSGECVFRWLRSLVRRRPMFKSGDVLETPLSRCLTVYHLIFYSVANMAGAGIYVLTGRLIRNEAGAAAFLSYMLAAASSAFTGLCYAEFATLIPRAGSVYVYTFLTIGELPAFIIGWTTVSDVIVGIASISKAFSGTINELSHNAIVNWTEQNVGYLDPNSDILAPTYDFVAMGLILLMMVITATGANISLTFNMVITSIQIVCLLIISVTCFVYGSPKSWSAEHGGFAPHGVYGVISGATIAVFAFSGFDSIANASEETIDPKKNIPRALLGSLIIISLLYFLASFGLAFLVPRELINYSSPFVHGFARLNVYWMVWISAIGTLLATGAGKVTTMYIVPRVFYAIANDGLIFRFFGKVEKVTQVPLISLFFGGTIAALLALFFNIQTLAEFVSLGILFSYFTIGIDILVLRYWMTGGADRTEDDLTPLEEVDSVNPEDSDVAMVRDKGPERVMKIRSQFACIAEKFPMVKTGRFFVLATITHVVITLVFAIFVDYIIDSTSVVIWVSATVIFLFWIASVVSLCIFEPSESKDTYQTPLMPMAPVMTIFINSILIARLPALTWARFAIWMSVGLIIYFLYGRRNSVANLKNEHLPLDKSNTEGQQKESYGTTGVD